MPSALGKTIDITRKAWSGFRKDDGFNLAASLAFFGLLSIIPLTLIVISVIGHVLGQSETLFAQIVIWIQETIPQAERDFVETLHSLVTRKMESGWIGIVLLFGAASVLFTNLEKSLDTVLKSARRRNFWHSRALAIALIFLTALLIYIPALMTLVSGIFANYKVHIAAGGLFRGDLFFIIAHILIFTFLVRVVPNQSVPMRNIGIGALLFGALSLIARQIFHLYMWRAFDRFSLIYGSLTVGVMLILWLYYLSAIFLFSAKFVNVLPKRK